MGGREGGREETRAANKKYITGCVYVCVVCFGDLGREGGGEGGREGSKGRARVRHKERHERERERERGAGV